MRWSKVNWLDTFYWLINRALKERGPYGRNALRLANSLGELRTLIGAEGVAEADIGRLFVEKDTRGESPIVGHVEARSYPVVCEREGGQYGR